MKHNTVVIRYGSVQKLERHWFMFGLKIWTSVIDHETIPEWACIQVATLGSTDWKSKFKEYI
jgi:hypothetical protein